MMNIEMKQKWIEALLSGDYKQATGILRNEKSEFCCLGVLCDVIDTKVWKITNSNIAEYLYMDHTTSLPKSIQELSGIDDVSQGVLIDMNDSGKSFVEIAEYIRDNL